MTLLSTVQSDLATAQAALTTLSTDLTAYVASLAAPTGPSGTTGPAAPPPSTVTLVPTSLAGTDATAAIQTLINAAAAKATSAAPWTVEVPAAASPYHINPTYHGEYRPGTRLQRHPPDRLRGHLGLRHHPGLAPDLLPALFPGGREQCPPDRRRPDRRGPLHQVQPVRMGHGGWRGCLLQLRHFRHPDRHRLLWRWSLPRPRHRPAVNFNVAQGFTAPPTGAMA